LPRAREKAISHAHGECDFPPALVEDPRHCTRALTCMRHSPPLAGGDDANALTRERVEVSYS